MKKKLIVLVIIIALIGIVTIFDFVKMQTVTISLLNVNPEPAFADSQKPVAIDVELKNFQGKPVSGHNLFAIALNGGAFKSYRVKTDNNGKASFIYYPYDVRDYQTVENAKIRIRDESNSVFIEMYPKIDITIEMAAPDSVDSNNMTTDDFLNN